MSDPFEGFYVNQNGQIAVACMLCDSIRVNMIAHLQEDHDGNPVAARILANIFDGATCVCSHPYHAGQCSECPCEVFLKTDSSYDDW